MDYEKLSYCLKDNAELPDTLRFIKTDELDFTEVGDGDLNYVLRVSSKENSGKSVILKYAPPYIKALGPEYPLDPCRNKVEHRALTKFNEICPGSVPRTLYCSEKEHYAIMEDLRGYKVLRMDMINGVLDLDTVHDIVDSILKLHQNSHKRRLSPEEFTEMRENFRNEVMVNVSDEYIFRRPWLQNDPTNTWSTEIKNHLHLVYSNEALLQNVKELREKFLSQAECLIHGDLHTGSIMTKGKHAKMIDVEFAYVGPAAFDIGMLLANFVLSFYAHCHYPLEGAPNFREIVKEAILETVTHYFEGMSSWMNTKEFEVLLEETAGFAGCELLSRIIGTTRLPECEGRPLTEVTCLHMGLKLITRQKKVKTVKDLISTLVNEFKS